jgi:hypothetical protein
MEIEGPAAEVAHRFTDKEWAFVCNHPQGDTNNIAFEFRSGLGIAPGCRSSAVLPSPSGPAGSVRVLAMGRLAAGIERPFADQSLVGRTLLLGAARKTIRMVQQDVAFSLSEVNLERSWPQAPLERMVDLILRGGDVYIILSHLDAASPVGTYSNGVPIEKVAHHIADIARARSKLPQSELDDQLCAHLHLAPLQFGPNPAWPDGKPFGVHAKFWMIDDRAFYIGSENLYPADLQEFGYVVEDDAATAQVRHAYWEPAWTWSQRAAISGSEAQSCVFKPPATDPEHKPA